MSLLCIQCTYTIYVLYNMTHNAYISLATHQKLLQGQTAIHNARYSTYSQHAIATLLYTHVQSHKTKCLTNQLSIVHVCLKSLPR